MHSITQASTLPSRILYTMLRVRNLERSIAFYCDVLGMRELRREDYSEGGFTLVFIGYGDETSDAVIELTYNWDQSEYEHGSAFGHIALEVKDIYKVCEHAKNLGVKVTRSPGPMKFSVDETGHKEIIAFIEDPDGYKIEFVENKVRRE